MDINNAINLCLKNINKNKMPEYIEIKYIDSLDFYNLKNKGINEKILEIPVITTTENNKNFIYVNYNEFINNEYYCLELLFSQIIRIIVEVENLTDLKNTIFSKYIENGKLILNEYYELKIVFDSIYTLYNSKEYYPNSKNPYFGKQNKKIALKMLKSSLSSKKGYELISSIIYCFVRIERFHKTFKYENITEDKEVSDLLNKLHCLLKELNFNDKKKINQIGHIANQLAFKKASLN